jgi:putative two-component system response regulator
MSQRQQPNRARILIVDDQDANIGLLRRILSREGYEQVRSTTDGCEAAGIFAEFKPDLVLLDLHMPNRDGFQVLEDLGPAINNGGYLPVLMLTGDASVEAKRGALSLGAKDFLAKPFDATEVMLRIRNLLETRFLYLSLENQNAVLETRVEARTRDLMRSQIEILERLARAGEIRDDDTGRHTQRVGQLSSNLARALGLPGHTVDSLRCVAPLHDVGKIGIPDSILRKPGILTDDELVVMRTHTVIGAQILSGGLSDLMMAAGRIALSHHEWWNGAGYPHGISGNQIPIEARIVAVADVLDAVTHARPYRPAWPMDAALKEIQRKSGSHFDPDVVEALMKSRCHLLIPLTPTTPMRVSNWPQRSRAQ